MSLTPTGMRYGRDNVLKLMEILGNPQNTLKVFHVTGSNGKWSVCQMLSQVLWKKFSKKVGLFTSPHFIEINERFQINGKLITNSRLEKYYEKVLNLSENHDIPLSFFEIQVVVMILYFVDEKVDYAIVEVGLGWLYDGTNIFSHPLACFITSITLEHGHVLGKTRRSILKNKLWIVKPGTKLYTHIQNKQVREYCRENNVSCQEAPRSRGVAKDRGVLDPNIKPSASSLGTSLDREAYLTNLPGDHQQKNAMLVSQALRDIWLSERWILEGLKNIDNPGRFEWITPTILVDTANNYENIKILTKMVKDLRIQKQVVVIFGTTQENPTYAAELAQMIPCDIRILVDDFSERSLPCQKYASLLENDQKIHFFHEKEKITEILRNAKNIKIVYGSFYLIGEIFKLSIHKPFASG